jgi:hypothetical protein
MNSFNKSIEEVIEILYDTIKSKKEIIHYFRKNHNVNNEKEQLITIQRLKLIEFIDEFEITVSQSLQAIQTLQTELSNLKENKEGKLINRTFLGSKIENSNLYLSNINSIYRNNKINIQQKEKEELKKEIKDEDFNNHINKTNDLINNVILNETKLKFDYSKLASKINNNESELSLVTNPNNTNYIKEKNNVLKDDDKLIPEVEISNIIQDDNLNNKNDLNNISISTIKTKNNENKKDKTQLSNLILSENNELEPEIEQIKIPIRQSLRKLISKGNKNENKVNNTINNINKLINDEVKNFSKKEDKIINIEKENKIKNLLSKINSEESFKVYLSNKYGEGEYNQFLKKLKNNEIEFDSLENELKIIKDLVITDRNIRKQKNGNYKSIDNIFNNNNKYLKSTNYSRKNSKGNNSFYSNEGNPNEYIEPLNFANFLRGDNNIKKNKNKNRNLSKKKIKNN